MSVVARSIMDSGFARIILRVKHGLGRVLAALSLALLVLPQALHSAQAAVGDNLLTSAQYRTTCGLYTFDVAQASCAGPVVTWSQTSWGANTAQFSLVQDSITGSQSAYLKVSDWVDGSSYWRHTPVNVKPSTMYRYSVSVKTAPSTIAWAEVEFALANGGYRYFPLSTVGTNTSWAKFSDDFFTPSDAVTATVYVFLRSNGGVAIDNAALIELAPPGSPSFDSSLNYSLRRPLVSITFDDGTGDIWNNAMPLLDAKGYKTTQYLVSTFIGTDGFMGVNNIVDLNNAGHELASHSSTHRSLVGLTSTDLSYETYTAQSTLRFMFPSCYLQNTYGTEKCFSQFAFPYGDVDQTVLNQIKRNHRSARGTNDGLNTRSILTSSSSVSMQAKYRLHAQMVLNPSAGGGGVAELNRWLSDVKASKTWLILVYHRVKEDPDAYGLTPAEFGAHLDAIASSGLCVTPEHQALNEIERQGSYLAKCGGSRYSSHREYEHIDEPSDERIDELNRGWDRHEHD